jgi:DNA repair exonuclease SbcCD ATPase subunit
MRGAELLALQDTIKMLNSDDALELFKKTLPGASSFIQVQSSSASAASRAAEIMKSVREGSLRKPSFDFIVLALHGKKEGFGKVIKLIDDLVGELKKEQLNDEHKKEYCEAQFDQAEDKKKTLEQDISDAEKNIEDDKETVKTLLSEIDALEDGIRALDKQVADATDQRKEEASDYQNLMANNMAANGLLDMAKNRLNKFYNPKLAALQSKADPGPAPEGPKEYSKNSEGGNGVVAMIDVLIKDLDKEMTEAEFTEKDAQEDYETMMKDASQKRAEDSKAITDKNQMKADTDARIEETQAAHKSATKELMATEEYISQLHGDCDWLIKYFDIRKEARTNEIDALGKAKAVLSGADFSFLQRRSAKFLGSF